MKSMQLKFNLRNPAFLIGSLFMRPFLSEILLVSKLFGDVNMEG